MSEISDMFATLKVARENAEKFEAEQGAAEREEWVKKVILSVGEFGAVAAFKTSTERSGV